MPSGRCPSLLPLTSPFLYLSCRLSHAHRTECSPAMLTIAFEVVRIGARLPSGAAGQAVAGKPPAAPSTGGVAR